MAKSNWTRSVRMFKRKLRADREHARRVQKHGVKAKPRAGAAITPGLIALMRARGVPAAELEQYGR